MKLREDGVEVILNYVEPYEIVGESSNLILEEEFRIGIEREHKPGHRR